MMKAIFFTYLLVMNMIGFIMMGSDKRRATRHQWRIPEKTLFAVSLFGGSAGVWMGMYLFRHKTKHLNFLVGMPLILLIQSVFLAWFIW